MNKKFTCSFTEGELGGPTPQELVKLLDQCDISQSLNSTPCVSPSPSIIGSSYSHRLAHQGQGLLGLSESVPNLEVLETEEGAVGGHDSSQVTQSVTLKFVYSDVRKIFRNSLIPDCTQDTM